MRKHPFLTLMLGIISSTVMLTLSVAFWLMFTENMVLGIGLGVTMYVVTVHTLAALNHYFWAKEITKELLKNTGEKT